MQVVVDVQGENKCYARCKIGANASCLSETDRQLRHGTLTAAAAAAALAISTAFMSPFMVQHWPRSLHESLSTVCGHWVEVSIQKIGQSIVQCLPGVAVVWQTQADHITTPSTHC